ncbi:probable zinc metalloprotease EGY1, chloroplastic isoform X2 [Telopea speciosissima]|uniref:probable zinc metalloprotease EGY1, chloroplastic isoform X2 n=1 Tax=Telopea speciosissima TaxID=54955 RepID=UPI001CC4F500|nr:probable zinc metalloprotease EGY1, chloroplastic isoform X2 [Telopea speciosissima]
MGTLTSCSLTTLNFRFRVCHTRGAFSGRIRQLEHKSLKNICFLCTERSKREILGRRFDRFTCFSINGNEEEDNTSKGSNLTTTSTEEAEARNADEFKSEQTPASISSRSPNVAPMGPAYDNFQIDSFKLMELLGPEKVDPTDVKLIKKKLFGYSTFWVTREEPFGDLGEGILFLGNLRGKREAVFTKLQRQLAEVTGDKYNLFMVEEPNSEGPDPRGGPRVSFGLLRKEVSEPGPTTLWQYVIALLLFVLTTGSCVELGIASQINRLPPEVMKYFTDPNATEPPDMQLLLPFVDSALPLAYGVLGVQLFHEVGHFLAAFPKKVKLGIPYFIPNITLGSFGAITQGHACGHCLDPPSCDCRCGLTTSAFNMLPVGCLDGGRAVQGAFGKNALIGFGLTTYTLLGLGVLGGPLSLPWGLYVLICQRTLEKPCLNDVSEVGTWRRTALIVAILLVVLTLLPLWDELAEELGIGLVTTF